MDQQQTIERLQDRVLYLEQELKQAAARQRTEPVTDHCPCPGDNSFRQLVNNVDAILWEADPDTWQFTFVSKGAEAILGYPLQDWLQVPGFWVSILHPDDRDAAISLCMNATNAGLDHQFEYRALAVDGSTVWLRDLVRVIRNDSGQVIKLRGIMIDVSQRKQAEVDLAISEARHRRLVELLPDAVYIHSDGILVFANRLGARLLGAAQPEQLYGRTALDFVHPDYLEMVRKRLASLKPDGGSNPTAEMVFVGLDGRPVEVEVSSLLTPYLGRESVLVVAREIGERNRLRNELLKSQRLESLGLLAGGIAHDFNNLLTGILGNLNLARRTLEQGHPALRRLQECERATTRASGLTQQLLTFARGGEPVKELLDVEPLLREAASFILHGSAVRAELCLADHLWSLKADSGQLTQLLHNILINAVQAMPNGGTVTIRAANRQLTDSGSDMPPPGDYLQISIEDQGCGIPNQNLGQVFDPYFSTKPSGNGLGLSSAYSIVKRHGGDIQLSSCVGTGTTVSILLPALQQQPPATEQSLASTPVSGSGRILLMDDETMVREVAEEILRHLGYEVESCASGQDALVHYREALQSGRRFDAVILDLTIPGAMGGAETAGRILKDDPSALLLVASGYANDPVIANFAQYGFRSAVRKPYTVEILAKELHHLLSNRECSLPMPP